jgi:hypothetical protein
MKIFVIVAYKISYAIQIYFHNNLLCVNFLKFGEVLTFPIKSKQFWFMQGQYKEGKRESKCNDRYAKI